MMELVKVSILISVFNPVWDYLEKTLDSIQKQSLDSFEVIVVNDGCDAGRLIHLLEDYSFTYKVVCNPTNLGLPRALNRGLQECKGKYVARIDDDDVMEMDRLRIQYSFMEKHEDVVSVFSNCRIIDSGGKTLKEDTDNHNRRLKKKLLYEGNCLCHSTLFARRGILLALGGYDEKMTYAQDYDLYLRMMDFGRLYVIPQMLVGFRSDPDRITRNKHILSSLFSYYASLKNMNGFDVWIFGSRTLRMVRTLVRILKNIGRD